MSKVLKRATAMLAVMIASLVFVTTALGSDARIALEEGRTVPGAG